MGQAFIFVPLLAMTWMFGLFLAMVSAHYFLSVLEESGQGNEQIDMPNEPFVDWAGKVVYLAFFVILWGIPSLIMMASTRDLDEVPRFLAISLPFWLVFPVGILSPLCLQSRWVPFWPGLLNRMSQKMGATVQLYLFSLPVMLLLSYSFWQLTQSENGYVLIFFYAPITAVCFLLYARLLGRYGFVLTFTKGADEPKPKKKKRPRPRAQVIYQQPEFIQPNTTKGVIDPFGEEVTGYGVNLAAPEAHQAAPTTIQDEESYVMDQRLETPEPMRELTITSTERERVLAPPPEEEVKMFMKNRQVQEPKTPFGGETFSFLLGPDMTMGLLKLTGGFALFSLLLHFMAAARPL